MTAIDTRYDSYRTSHSRNWVQFFDDALAAKSTHIKTEIPPFLQLCQEAADNQPDLMFSVLMVERKRSFIQLSLEQQAQFDRVDGVNRTIAYTAFITFLKSEEKNLRLALAMTMNERARNIFNEAIRTLVEDLTPSYLEISALIEKKISININNLKEIVENTNKALFPLGWVRSGPEIGHHLFLYLEKDAIDNSQGVIRFIDTEGKLSESNSTTLLSRACGAGYRVEIDDAIHKIAHLLQFQFSSFTDHYLKENPTNDLLRINYNLACGDQKVEDPPSPLLRWNWLPANSCAFASFQPLLQILAFSHAKDLIDCEAQNLTGYFEFIVHGFKLWQIDKFSPRLTSFPCQSLKTAVYRSIFESGERING